MIMDRKFKTTMGKDKRKKDIDELTELIKLTGKNLFWEKLIFWDHRQNIGLKIINKETTHYFEIIYNDSDKHDISFFKLDELKRLYEFDNICLIYDLLKLIEAKWNEPLGLRK